MSLKAKLKMLLFSTGVFFSKYQHVQTSASNYSPYRCNDQRYPHKYTDTISNLGF